MKYRGLTSQEISELEENSCTAADWSQIVVHPDFNTKHIARVHFSGDVSLGKFEKEFPLPGGLQKHAGVRDATLHNCSVGNNVIIENVHNCISNYNIGDDVVIRNINSMYTEGHSSFGNGVEVAVLNETGGREVMIYDKLSAHFAYIFSFYRHRPILIKKMQNMVVEYAERVKSDKGTIGAHVTILNAGTIKNVRIGDYATIEGVAHIENGSINSNEYDPVHIGYNVIMKDFIISSGSSVEDGTMLTRCFVGQACQLGHTYSASDSLFFSNCQGENGEACAIFAGPYTVTHHKSTLLIAGMFSFMNAGSGSNQSNHMYKLGPIHQGIVERGGKTTSNSYVLWPAKIGAFSLIMGRHYQNSDTSDMPFSYLIENDDKSVLVPAVNLRSVGTIRDAQKFPKRDKRKDVEKLDQLNFNLLSPYTIQKMFSAIDILKNLQRTCGETSDVYTYQSCLIKNNSLKRGIILYEMAIHKFLGNSIISRFQDYEINNIDDIRKRLLPDNESGEGKWSDLAGLIAPRNEITSLIDSIESGKISNIYEINAAFENLHRDYYSLEWTWAWQKIQSFYDLSVETVTEEDIISIIRKWQASVVSLDKMIYEDAKKEFSLSSYTGFGIDGDAHDRKTDFEQVRGAFENNEFVKTVLTHIDKKTALGENLISRLQQVN